MLRADVKDLTKYELDLLKFARKAFPFATKATINVAAFDAMRQGRINARNELVLRNAWTAQSIQVDTARTLVVSQQMATVGSVAPYMALQEFGGTERGARGKNKPIPTGYAAGQDGNVGARSKLPTNTNRMLTIKLQRLQQQATVRNRRALNAALVRQAAAGGSKFIYMNLGRRKGIFRVVGGKKHPRVRMVWDLSRRQVHIPQRRWLLPAVMGARDLLPRFFADALVYQLRRHKVFGY